MKKIKKFATLGLLVMALLNKPAKADFFDGCRPPMQYAVQLDARYNGKKIVLIPKYFSKKWYAFAATNLSAEKIRPYIGAGAIISALENNLHIMPTLEFDTASNQINFSNYTTAILAKGKINIDHVITLNHERKPFSELSAGLEVYTGLRLGMVKSLTDKGAALRFWYNPQNVKYILGLRIAKDGIMLNGRIHF